MLNTFSSFHQSHKLNFKCFPVVTC